MKCLNLIDKNKRFKKAKIQGCEFPSIGFIYKKNFACFVKAE
jgi:hypothetical protein